jgi:hypothetical protein
LPSVVADPWRGPVSETLGDESVLPPDSKKTETARRFERLLRREGLQSALMIAGVFFLVVGILAAIAPYGPPLSNPDVIPKADPRAGLGFLQVLGSDTGRFVSLGFAFFGVVVLVCSRFFVIRGDDDSRGNNG